MFGLICGNIRTVNSDEMFRALRNQYGYEGFVGLELFGAALEYERITGGFEDLSILNDQ